MSAEPNELVIAELMRAMGVPEIKTHVITTSGRWGFLAPDYSTEFRLEYQSFDMNRAYLEGYCRRQASILGLNHPNISKIIGSRAFESSVLVVFSDSGRAECLSEILRKNKGPIPASQSLKYMHDVLCALEYLHAGIPDKTVVHGDLNNISSIAVDCDDVAMLTDFGHSYQPPGTHTCSNPDPNIQPTLVAAIRAEPPECRDSRPVGWLSLQGSPILHPPGDMWSFGLPIVRILAYPDGSAGDKSIFSWLSASDEAFQSVSRSIYGAVEQIKQGNPPNRPSDVLIDDVIWDFAVKKCWVMEPSRRITAQDAKPIVKEFMRQAKIREELENILHKYPAPPLPHLTESPAPRDVIFEGFRRIGGLKYRRGTSGS